MNGIAFRICTDHDPVIAIRNFVSARTVGFRTTITFTADVQNAVEGAEVCWFVDGKLAGTGSTYTAEEVRKDFTVQAQYVKNGRTLAESQAETVTVKTGCFARLLAIIRALFGRLPKIVQTYFGVEITEKP